mmetsp:Transcript_16021/g.38260  ORF Transcript_16021/g.38260 Transcript_16021/m.38260 type:complete len:308 (+) Transcript_16021:4177-5100(+)
MSTCSRVSPYSMRSSGFSSNTRSRSETGAAGAGASDSSPPAGEADPARFGRGLGATARLACAPLPAAVAATSLFLPPEAAVMGGSSSLESERIWKSWSGGRLTERPELGATLSSDIRPSRSREQILSCRSCLHSSPEPRQMVARVRSSIVYVVSLSVTPASPAAPPMTMPDTSRCKLGRRPWAASISSCAGAVPKSSTRREKARQTCSSTRWSWWLSKPESSGTASATRWAHSMGRPRHRLAAVLTAMRWTPVAKKSTNCSTACMPPPRRMASGCSCESFSRAERHCSARSMYSIERSFSHRMGTAS